MDPDRFHCNVLGDELPSLGYFLIPKDVEGRVRVNQTLPKDEVGTLPKWIASSRKVTTSTVFESEVRVGTHRTTG